MVLVFSKRVFQICKGDILARKFKIMNGSLSKQPVQSLALSQLKFLVCLGELALEFPRYSNF